MTFEQVAQVHPSFMREALPFWSLAWKRGVSRVQSVKCSGCNGSEGRNTRRSLFFSSQAFVEVHLRQKKPGVTLLQNNGVVEGQGNKLKLIKRMMYGRAKFPPLRQRVLCAL
jgi:hypothetical protein